MSVHLKEPFELDIRRIQGDLISLFLQVNFEELDGNDKLRGKFMHLFRQLDLCSELAKFLDEITLKNKG